MAARPATPRNLQQFITFILNQISMLYNNIDNTASANWVRCWRKNLFCRIDYEMWDKYHCNIYMFTQNHRKLFRVARWSQHSSLSYWRYVFNFCITKRYSIFKNVLTHIILKYKFRTSQQRSSCSLG